MYWAVPFSWLNTYFNKKLNYRWQTVADKPCDAGL